MPVNLAVCPLPRTLLHRIGYGPDPLAPPDWARALPDGTFGGRFDDPRHLAVRPEQRFRSLYLAATPTGAFGETIARWRPSLRTLAAAPSVAGPSGRGFVPRTWRDPRRLASAHTLSPLPIVDLEDPDTIQTCRTLLAPLAEALGLPDVDISALIGPHRHLTQTLAAMIYQEGWPASPAMAAYAMSHASIVPGSAGPSSPTGSLSGHSALSRSPLTIHRSTMPPAPSGLTSKRIPERSSFPDLFGS